MNSNFFKKRALKLVYTIQSLSAIKEHELVSVFDSVVLSNKNEFHGNPLTPKNELAIDNGTHAPLLLKEVYEAIRESVVSVLENNYIVMAQVGSDDISPFITLAESSTEAEKICKDNAMSYADEGDEIYMEDAVSMIHHIAID